METPPLDNERHLRYWQRCLRSVLPHQYTSNDSIRMTLGCFIVAAVDLLSPTSTSPAGPAPSDKPKAASITPSDRLRIREWVLSCQHPGGGFCGAPTHALRPQDYAGWDAESHKPETANSGAANVAATYFALVLLALVAEDSAAESAFSGVRRAETLDWLRRLQRDDGSFGEVLYDVPAQAQGRTKNKWVVAGGSDTRYCYLAAAIRWMLRGDIRPGDSGWVEDINVESLIGHIRQGQTYDGGFAETSHHESHAGYAYCAISALSLLDRPAENSTASHDGAILRRAIADHPALTEWLASRPFEYLEEVEEAEDNEEDNFAQPACLADTVGASEVKYAGFNGRCNKVADTCYTWWVGGTLSILGLDDDPERRLVPTEAARRFLVEKTQHLIGGFAKHPKGPPDIYHAYLGLAALATLGETERLKEFDSALVVSMDAVKRIEAGRRGLFRAAGKGKQGTQEGQSAERRLREMGLDMLGREVSWLPAVQGSCQ